MLIVYDAVDVGLSYIHCMHMTQMYTQTQSTHTHTHTRTHTHAYTHLQKFRMWPHVQPTS